MLSLVVFALCISVAVGECVFPFNVSLPRSRRGVIEAVGRAGATCAISGNAGDLNNLVSTVVIEFGSPVVSTYSANALASAFSVQFASGRPLIVSSASAASNSVTLALRQTASDFEAQTGASLKVTYAALADVAGGVTVGGNPLTSDELCAFTADSCKPALLAAHAETLTGPTVALFFSEPVQKCSGGSPELSTFTLVGITTSATELIPQGSAPSPVWYFAATAISSDPVASISMAAGAACDAMGNQALASATVLVLLAASRTFTADQPGSLKYYDLNRNGRVDAMLLVSSFAFENSLFPISPTPVRVNGVDVLNPLLVAEGLSSKDNSIFITFDDITLTGSVTSVSSTPTTFFGPSLTCQSGAPRTAVDLAPPVILSVEGSLGFHQVVLTVSEAHSTNLAASQFEMHSSYDLTIAGAFGTSTSTQITLVLSGPITSRDAFVNVDNGDPVRFYLKLQDYGAVMFQGLPRWHAVEPSAEITSAVISRSSPYAPWDVFELHFDRDIDETSLALTNLAISGPPNNVYRVDLFELITSRLVVYLVSYTCLMATEPCVSTSVDFTYNLTGVKDVGNVPIGVVSGSVPLDSAGPMYVGVAVAVGSNQLKVQFSETVRFAGSLLDQTGPFPVNDNGLRATAVDPNVDASVFLLTLERAVTVADLGTFFASPDPVNIEDLYSNSDAFINQGEEAFAIQSATYADEDLDGTIDRIRFVTQRSHIAFTSSSAFSSDPILSLGAVSFVDTTTFEIPITGGVAVGTGSTVSMTYTTGGPVVGRLTLLVLQGESSYRDKFEMLTATFPLSDGAKPVLLSAVAMVNTVNVVLTFSEPLGVGPLDATDVGVSFNPSASVTGISHSGTQVTITLSRSFLLADYATANISSCGSNIRDVAGNSAFCAVSFALTKADTTLPNVTEIVTEGDGLGKLAALQFTFSEPMLVGTTGCTVNGGTSKSLVVTSVSSFGTIDISDLNLTTDSIPTVTCSSPSLTDESGNVLTELLPNVVDRAAPVALSAVATDDYIVVTFSEPISGGSLTVTSCQTPPNSCQVFARGASDSVVGPAQRRIQMNKNFTLADFQCTNPVLSVGGSGVQDLASVNWVPGSGKAVTPSVTGPFTITSGFTRDVVGPDGNADSVDLTFSRAIDVCSVALSNITPAISGMSWDNQTLRLTLTSPGSGSSSALLSVPIDTIFDKYGNSLTAVNYTALDGVGPVLIAVQSQVDSLLAEFVFSENLALASLSASNFTYSGGIEGATVLAGSACSVSGAVVTCSVNAAFTLSDFGSDRGNIAGSALIRDSLGNLARATPENRWLTNTDTTAPTIVSAETADENGDLMVDMLIVTLSEAIDDSTIVSEDFSVTLSSSPQNVNVSSGSETNDAVIKIRFINNGPANTGSTVVLKYTTGSLKDRNGNLLANVSSFTSIDKVSPALVEAFGHHGSFTNITMRFSEAVSGNNWSKANFVYRDKFGANVPNKFVTDPTRVEGDDTLLQATIENFQADFVAGLSPNLALLAAAVTDAAGNSANTVRQVVLRGSDTTPLVLSACSQVDQDANGKVDGIRVEFNKSILDSTVLLTRFTVTGGLLGLSCEWDETRVKLTRQNRLNLFFHLFVNWSAK